ncbi:hypothetical protein GUJ93_ZPchr0011g28806 [Zizania palustris]|uniref:Uncharacterized protein n=1 Tax=Zizania palustris TaxID=103762 RepID=A0A8J5WI16_ZIZPA|nr:hypothetical protein GUJ93_ZPchr0011g28806 [Zizania palustris]
MFQVYKLFAILEKAIRGVCTDLHPQSMVIADLGCASTPNTLLFVSEAITTVCENTSNDSTVEASSMEVQFFLNDLPNNNFNYIFQSLEKSNLLATDLPGGEED